MARLTGCFIGFLLAAAFSSASADENRARINYLIHCQGCHLPEAAGVPGHVPRMHGFLGYFQHSERGRKFIMQVPGAATASLSDAHLAELMNWLLTAYSADELPADFKPYTKLEVSEYRPHLEKDPDNTRAEILSDIARTLPALAKQLKVDDGY